MKAAETQILTVNQGDSIIHMSIADKESNTGLVFNQRLLVLNEGSFFGYLSKFDTKKDDPKKVDLNQVKDKSKIQIKCIKAIEHDEQNLAIKFIHIEKNRQQTKQWSFKLANEEMVKKWVYLLQQEKAKRSARSAEKRSRSRQGNNSLSSSKANIVVPKINQMSPEKGQSGPENEFKQQPKMPPQNTQENIYAEDSQNRQFVNPLYGYDSVESDAPKRPVNNQKKPPEPIKRAPQVPQPIVQPPSPLKNLNSSPKRENNFMKKQPEEQRFLGKKQVQKSEIEFRQSPQKLNEPMQRQKSPLNQSNNAFNKKPRQSYVDMIEKIVKESQQRTFEKMRERASYEESINNQSSERDLYVNGILEEFIRYDTGETEKWKNQNWKQDEWEETEKRSHNRLKQLEELQQIAFDIQKQQRNISIQQITPKPVNYNDFSKEIALMLRNKRFQRQGHDDLSPEKQNKPSQLTIKQMPFSYRYLLATSPAISVNEREEDIMEVLLDWKLYCEDTIKKMVADMVSQSGKYKLKVKKSNIMYFELEDIQVKIGLAALKTVHFQVKDSKNPGQKSKEKRQQRISDYSAAKDLEVEFKNYCALNELFEKSEIPLKAASMSNQNSGFKTNINYSSRLKTPLTAVVEYFGFVALFKLNSKFEYRPDRINESYIKEKQQIITQMTNIDVKWLEQGAAKGYNPNEEPGTSKTSIFHIDENYYAQLHLQRGQMKLNIKSQKLTQEQKMTEARNIFDVDVLQDVDCFLLKDYLTKSLSNGILRKQLIDEMITRDQYKDTVLMNPKNITNPTTKSKIQADLTLFSGQVLEKLSVIILKLDNMTFYYLHPEEISDLFHKEGVNVRYMGLAFDNVSEVYAKKCLMTEITARVSKLLMRKTLQQVLLQNQQPNDKLSSPVKSSRVKRQKSSDSGIIFDVMDILNCILGCSPESTAMWSVLSQHAQFYFKCELSKEFIDPGYLLASLTYHCKLDVNWKRLGHVGEIFKKDDFFNPESLIGLKTQCKTYEPSSSKIYSSLQRIMGTNKSVNPPPKEQIFRELITQFGLSSNPLPQSLGCLLDSSFYSTLSIKQLLAEFIRPQTIKLPSSENNFGHLRVFNDLNQFPQKKSLSIKISEIKWYLRLKKKEKYLKKFEELVNMLNKFYGDFSPALGELYDVFANFHLVNSEYEDAITFAKSSLVNTLKICGTNHIKTAESYYNLSVCYLKANKAQDASSLLKKAKAIYESRQRVTTEAYANINLKLGLIMLTKNEIKQAVIMTSKALETFEEVQEFQEEEQSYMTVKNNINWKLMFENQKTQCYETLSRCYELSSNKQNLIKNLKVITAKIQQGFLYTVQEPTNLQKLLRVILTPFLHSLNAQECAIYIDVISAYTTANPIEINPRSYSRAYSLLQGRIKQKTFVENIESYLENSSSICDYVMLNNVLDDWKPFEKQYERETINDFVSITEELIYFLGQGYLTGALRQVLDTKNGK